MYWVDLLQLAFSVQCEDCFASSFSPITAAWATQGYWMQATIIEYMEGSGLATIASLLYVLAVGAGIVGYTLGSPPRNYLWYFFGPAMFHFLLFTTEPAKGVVWQMGIDGQGEPIFGNQTEVWKLAEVGLINQENVLRRGVQVSRADEPTQMAEVATVFLTIDGLFSDFIQGLVGLLGTKEMMTNRNAGDNTNIPDIDSFDSFAAADFYRISNSKWGMLENITYASVKDIKMLKSLAIFFGSDCGDALVKQIDQAKFTAATRARSGQLPRSIFKSDDPEVPNYDRIKEAMAKQGTSISPVLKQMFPPPPSGGCAGASQNSLTCFSELTQKASTYLNDDDNEWIACDNFLSYMIEGMRWESGNAYYQLINSAPETMEPKYVLFNLFYGWGIRRLTDGVPTGRPLNAHDELIKYTPNLILVHILRNMFEFTSAAPDQKFTPADDMINLTQVQQRNISSKTKFIEVYSWALMIPYIQGLVLYFLSIAYPVVCIAMIMPNLYKLPLTWVKFWFWAKSWDLGFALVMAIDKSVWAMMSNSPKSQTVLGYIAELSDNAFHPLNINVTCDSRPASAPFGRGCADAIVTDPTPMGADPFTEYLMPIFDRAMILSKNLEMDLANSYYIYIMAALYFAVPAVTGQLVGSIGGLAGGALDKMTDVKGVANAGVTSDKNQRLAAFSQIAGQERSFSTQRNPGGYGAEFGGAVLQKSVNQSSDVGAPAGGPIGKGNAQGSASGAGGPGANRVAGGGIPGMAQSLASFGTTVAAGFSGRPVGGGSTGINRAGLPGGAVPGGVPVGEQGALDPQAQSAFNGANIGGQVGSVLIPGGAVPGRLVGAVFGAMTAGPVAGGANANRQSPTVSGNSTPNGAGQNYPASQVNGAGVPNPVPGSSANQTQGGMSGNGAPRPAPSFPGNSISLPFSANTGASVPTQNGNQSPVGTSAPSPRPNISSSPKPIGMEMTSGGSPNFVGGGPLMGPKLSSSVTSPGGVLAQSVNSGSTNLSPVSPVNSSVGYGPMGGGGPTVLNTGPMPTSNIVGSSSTSQVISRAAHSSSQAPETVTTSSSSSPLTQLAASGGVGNGGDSKYVFGAASDLRSIDSNLAQNTANGPGANRLRKAGSTS